MQIDCNDARRRCPAAPAAAGPALGLRI